MSTTLWNENPHMLMKDSMAYISLGKKNYHLYSVLFNVNNTVLMMSFIFKRNSFEKRIHTRKKILSEKKNVRSTI